jgi:MSHA biogenesis protein MshP
MRWGDPLLAQKGFALILALFILLVLAALGAFMVTMSGVQSRTSLWAVQGARAYYAARSGLEWGIFRDLNSGACTTGILSVNGFDVTLSCSEQTVTEGGQTYKIFQVTALAEEGAYGSGDYVSRLLRARVTGATP